MCGIGGILRTDGEPIPEAWLDLIDRRIAHRGPDGHGRFRDRVEIEGSDGPRAVEVALIHRRLAVIDPAGGAQPMVSRRGRNRREGLVAVVFNGCIYNHRELRRQLKSAGHKFVTDHSDTEVLIGAHREWGAQTQDHLEGMYAYAIWDHDAASLTLARDWFGEKPLYHCADHDDDGVRLLVFGSDAVSVASLAADTTPSRVEVYHPWVGRYLQLGYAWRGRTVCRPGVAVSNVAPSGPFDGQAQGGARRTGRRSPTNRTVEPDEIERLIEQAVARRLEADVPLGCFLSGGVDSSLIACFAQKLQPGLRTFTVKMPDPRYDESGYARQVAEYLGTEHTTLTVDVNPAQDLIKLMDILGQPFGDSSILPTYWVSRAAREHVTVALSGDGGDELFVGYERYLFAEPLARHWRLLSKIPPGLFGRFDHRSRLRKLGRFGEMARDYPQLGVLATESIFSQKQIAALVGDAPLPQDDDPPHDPWTGAPDPDPPRCDAGDDASAALRWIDLQRYLPDDLLCKVDTASMAVALEVRCPFLDRDLARALFDAPIGQLIARPRMSRHRLGQRKGLLRRIARRHLPEGIVDRPKMGFAIPLGQWFRTDYGGMRTLLLDHLRSTEPFGSIQLARQPVRQLIQEHMSGRCDHGQQLFALLTLSMWAKGKEKGLRD